MMQLGLCALVLMLGVAAGQTVFDTGATYAKATTAGVNLMLSKMADIDADTKKVHLMLSLLKEVNADGDMVSDTSHVNVSALTMTNELTRDNVTHGSLTLRRAITTVTPLYSDAGTLKLTYDIAFGGGHYLVKDVYNVSVMTGDVVVTLEVHDWNFGASGESLDASMKVKGSAAEPTVHEDADMPNYLIYDLGDGAMLKLPKMMAKGDPFMKLDMTDDHFMASGDMFRVRMPKDPKLAYTFILSIHGDSGTGAAAHVSACAVGILALAVLQKFLF